MSAPSTSRVLSPAQARRVALQAQGFASAAHRARAQGSPRRVTMRQVQAELDRLAQLQIDSISVVARAHQVPLFSRLGPYDVALLERACGTAPRRLFEYWGHAASLVDVALQPALRWRMAEAAEHAWRGVVRVRDEQPGLVEHVLREVSDHGPLTARQIQHEEVRDRTGWGWNWSSVKTALEWQFWCGEITCARRNAAFERVYDLPARVLPAAVWERPTPSREDAQEELVRRSARALGVATEGCLADYFRLSRADARRAIAALEATGELEAVQVPGWSVAAWLFHELDAEGRPVPVAVPRRVRARALVSPFDSLVFERSRALGLFGLDYRIEIYVPEARRRHGYYVYPFLLDEAFEARVDLKADRAAGVLQVRAAWREPHPVAEDARVADELAAELWLMADWLGLGRVEVQPRGDFAGQLLQAVLPGTP